MLRNQILPHKHKYVRDLFLKSCANNWMPTEISMQNDIKQWKTMKLQKMKNFLLNACLGFFAGSESLVGNNLFTVAARFITDPECGQYIKGQGFEESLHNHTIVYICDSLDLDVKEVYEAYQNIPSIKAKDDFLMNITTDVNRQILFIIQKRRKARIVKKFFNLLDCVRRHILLVWFR